MAKQKKDNPFTLVFGLNKGDAEYNEELYVPYVINKAFAGWFDTVAYANELNQYPDLPKHMQFRFYETAIRPKYRQLNWIKKQEEDEEVEKIQHKYGVNEKIAKQYLKLIKGESDE